MRIPNCHIELGDSGDGQWWWRIYASNPNTTIDGDYHVYTSARTATRGAKRIARHYGIRIDSIGIFGKEDGS